jgi:hypothetical protein
VSEIIPTWLEDLKKSYEGDGWVDSIVSQATKGERLPEGIVVHTGLIRKGERIYVGQGANWRFQVIQSLHNSSIEGHSGILGTYHRVKKYFFLAQA